jgi:rSAM/selenodomain-associated transferase 1
LTTAPDAATAAAGTTLIIFAKAPVAGQVKTRLMPALGAAGAAELAARLLEHTVAAAMSAGFQAVELCTAPDASHPAFVRLAARHPGLQLGVQDTSAGADLGARMHHALTRRLAGAGQALLIGTDAPALDASMLREAALAMSAHDAVFVPAHDGGYALVGLTSPQPSLFSGMAWSTPQVMAQTRDRAQQAGLRWAELPAVADIDEPADLVHLPAGWPQ